MEILVMPVRWKVQTTSRKHSDELRQDNQTGNRNETGKKPVCNDKLCNREEGFSSETVGVGDELQRFLVNYIQL